MAHALCVETGQLAQDLHGLLRSLDPSRWRLEAEEAAREQLRRIRAELGGILQRHAPEVSDGRLGALYQGLEHLSELLERFWPQPSSSPSRLAERWAVLRSRLQPAYAGLAACLEHLSVPVPELRPTNYARNLFHFGCGLFAVLLVQTLLTEATMPYVAIPFALFCWTAEALRVRYPIVTRAFMAVLGPVSHPHEHHRVNSATWFATALAMLSMCCAPRVASAAVMVLAAGDPAGALIGRRFGRVRLAAGRTLEGSLGFVLVGALAALVTLLMAYPGLRTPMVLLVALGAAVAGALAELVTKKLDDNLTIPLGAAIGCALSLSLLGL